MTKRLVLVAAMVLTLAAGQGSAAGLTWVTPEIPEGLSERVAALVAPPIPAAWECIAQHEVGGNWGMQGSTFSGIGFLNAAWREWGGLEFAPNAGLATPAQQVEIGRRIVAAVGPSAWATAAECGLERGE